MTAPFFVAFPFWGCHAERSEASPSKRFCMRSLTCVRDDITKRCNLHGVMSFRMQRKRNEESQTNSRGFLTYVRNDICLSFRGVEYRRISPQAYVMLSDSEASPAKREYNRHRFE